MMEKRKLKRRARKKGEDTSVVPAAPDGLTATEDLDAHKPESENHSNGHSKDPKDAMGTAVRVQFVQRTIQVDARILLLYNLCRQRFPTYVASEGEWLLDIVSRYFAEHAEDFGLDATTLLSSVRSELEGAQP